ncbi:MAG TPA: hypothetical protein VF588_21365 [Pyrinomonadaceae bacterium]|jgi:hypothetical protein
MKNPLTVICRRQKLLANAVQVVSSAVYLPVLLALIPHTLFAQSADQTVAPPKSASLPRAFAGAEAPGLAQSP